MQAASGDRPAAGLVGDATLLATTVHPLQVLDEPLPETGHDFRVDLIVAGEEVIACPRFRRPPAPPPDVIRQPGATHLQYGTTHSG